MEQVPVMHDPQWRRVLDQSLRRLQGGAAGPQLAEMARDVLSGRIELHQAVNDPEYSSAIAGGLSDFFRWYDSLSEAEREEAAQRGQALLDEHQEDEQQEQDERPEADT